MCPTNVATFTEVPDFSKTLRYPAKSLQSHLMLGSRSKYATAARRRSLASPTGLGATPKPQLPITSVVIP